MGSRRRQKRLQKNAFLKQRTLNKTESIPGVHEVILVLDHLKPDFNIGKLLRSAAAFGAREVHIHRNHLF